jgi:hypothetical protein
VICDCCDRDSRWAHTSPDDVGWCTMCRTVQWRRDAPVRFYPNGRPEKGHACVNCDEPWGMGLHFVWHPECRCGVKGPMPTGEHELVEQKAQGRIARVRCRCGWTAAGRYHEEDGDEDADYIDDDFREELAMSEAVWAFEEHERREEDRRCLCGCHSAPACLPIHADRRERLPRPRRFTCEHSPAPQRSAAAAPGVAP